MTQSGQSIRNCMMCRLILLVAMIACSEVVIAEDGKDKDEQSCAVSKEVYDLIRRAEEMGYDLEKPEVPENFPPANSQNFHECFGSVKSLTNDLWLLLHGAAACEKRHPCQQLKNFLVR